MAKVIKSESDYRAALEEIERLIDLDPQAGSVEANELEVIGVLVEDYEKKKTFQGISMPDPIAAIEFRMEQQGLLPRDLVPFIGSRSKVSEILSRKRPLTLSMVRALHDGLGIPAKVLIQNAQSEDFQKPDDWSKYPVQEMVSRGWIDSNSDSINRFFEALPEPTREAVLCRKTDTVRSGRQMDAYALASWSARVIILANQMNSLASYRAEALTTDSLRSLARLSREENGPSAARDFLRRIGIPLIIEAHLPHTYLDGAAILIRPERPIIGLTVRYDRLDNFWFTLFHELGHIVLHSHERVEFFDDLDVDPGDDPREKEADKFADEMLIPATEWKTSPASRVRSPQAAEFLASRLQIHPAIVAGKMRHHWKNYRILNSIIGHQLVRKYFESNIWNP